MAIYQETQREIQVGLVTSGWFENTPGGAFYRGKSRPFILQDGTKNLYAPIREEVVEYFKSNHIDWWSGDAPSGHVLSSQIACLNHLFYLRSNPNVLLELLNNATELYFDEVLPIPRSLDENPQYIAFEAVSCIDHLNEQVVTRGSNCTSVDALMMARKDDETWLIPIEWKYTEFYNSEDKSTEDRPHEPKGSNGRGQKRMSRYNHLISESVQLKSLDRLQGSIYYQEPFYQLMRQTLWAEQIIQCEPEKWHNASKYLHLHIVPSANKDLLCKHYKCVSQDMEIAWKNMLNNPNLYLRIDPQSLLSPLVEDGKFADLINYLQTRYWN